jgi:uncharacterized flavoprotein (TIGR03862 family)
VRQQEANNNSLRHEGAPVVVIGGGPAGLMAAEALSDAGLQVDLYDAMPSVGRKFLLAGIGGLNITHSEGFEEFVGRYGKRSKEIRELLQDFDADALRAWAGELGISTFVGTSGRVFPEGMKAAPLLRAWLHRLRESGVRFHRRHRFTGWNASGEICFDTPDGLVARGAEATVLALGGASWARLGSDGAWLPLLRARGVTIADLMPANCGFETNWSTYLREHFAGAPLKSIAAACKDEDGRSVERKGELVITATGVEGSLVYALSALLRDEITRSGKALLQLDLAPDRSLEALTKSLALPHSKESRSNHWRKRAGIEGVKAALLREKFPAEALDKPASLAAAIKHLPLQLHATRPLDEAISTAGGVCFEDIDHNLMLQRMPGVFCAGEMLDWEAPTGGYLLTACFSSGRRAGQGALHWLRRKSAVNEGSSS